jgi:hypothetical protein
VRRAIDDCRPVCFGSAAYARELREWHIQCQRLLKANTAFSLDEWGALVLLKAAQLQWHWDHATGEPVGGEGTSSSAAGASASLAPAPPFDAVHRPRPHRPDLASDMQQCAEVLRQLADDAYVTDGARDQFLSARTTETDGECPVDADTPVFYNQDTLCGSIVAGAVASGAYAAATQHGPDGECRSSDDASAAVRALLVRWFRCAEGWTRATLLAEAERLDAATEAQKQTAEQRPVT